MAKQKEILVVRQCYISGEVRKPGTKLTLDEREANQAISSKRCVPSAAARDDAVKAAMAQEKERMAAKEEAKKAAQEEAPAA